MTEAELGERGRPRGRAAAADRVTAATADLTRRQLLAGTGAIALLSTLPMACAPAVSGPWADGTFWDDGQGWTA